jgi:glycosyltransferase involved in cell wall biosynthesis
MSDPVPRVSVIVPVRDRRALLRDTLSALDKQTYRDFEVLIVDDGSTDGSAEEVVAAADRGLPARVIRGDGRGAVAARRRGVAEARGEILAFTDSDCAPDEEWLAAGVASLDEGADVVQGPTVPARPPRPLERTVWAVTPTGLFETCNVFYRRAAYDACGGFDPGAADRLRFRSSRSMRGLGFGEDAILGWRVTRSGRSAFAPEARVYHHVFPADARESVRRAWMAGAFPALVKEIPELRDALLRRKTLLGTPDRALLHVATVATLLQRRRVAALVLVAWIGARARLLWRRAPDPRAVAASLPLDMAVQVVLTAALAAGSVRARTPVL